MRVLVLLACLFSCTISKADSFDTLLHSIKRDSAQELAVNSDRVKRFVAEKNQQAELLKEAKHQLSELLEHSENLKISLDENEKTLVESEAMLTRKVGDLGELFGAIRQTSGELKADFENSLVSVQLSQRSEFLNALAQSKELPDVQDLEALWFTMLQEMGESGKTRRFDTEVVQKDGSVKTMSVVRIGAYTALSDGRYLQFTPGTQLLAELQKQPSARFERLADEFEGQSSELVKVMIDPTRGQLLGMLTLKPTMTERIKQGGVIGYIILGLGVLGILIAFLRYIYLSFISARINKQLKNMSTPKDNNPLGRIAAVYLRGKNNSFAEQELALEEAMLKEVPVMERYNGLIKLLAAVSPLLGLLGTVIGMIITFQAITLFGTSDPKLMAGGISTALVTTVLGLSVAIPLLFAYTFIAAKSKQLIDIIEIQSVGLAARVL